MPHNAYNKQMARNDYSNQIEDAQKKWNTIYINTLRCTLQYSSFQQNIKINYALITGKCYFNIKAKIYDAGPFVIFQKIYKLKQFCFLESVQAFT